MFSVQGLEPWLRPYAEWLLLSAQAAGAKPEVTSTRRTYGQQTRLYLKYLMGGSPYPAAYPGTSKHEAGLAFDLVTISDDYWLPLLGAWWRSAGGKWYASDPIHFEV